MVVDGVSTATGDTDPVVDGTEAIDLGSLGDGRQSNGAVVNTGRGYLNDRDCEWDPWNGVRAPKGYIFRGFLTFVVLGPTTDCHEVLLKMGGTANDDKSHKKTSGQENIQKCMNQMAEEERARGGPDRDMSLHTKVNLAAIAQGEDDADMRDDG